MKTRSYHQAFAIRAALWTALPAFSLMTACKSDDPDTGYVPGQTSFVSASGEMGDRIGGVDMDEPYVGADAGSDNTEASDSGSDDGDRAVEEGDIYRLAQDGQLLNLNYFRGLQVIDFQNIDEPEIIGRFPVTGTPVEMYVVDNTVYLLLNNWTGYYGSPANTRVESRYGGLILAVDISDPTQPREIARSFVDGRISTSRLIREGENAALYVVANWTGEWETAEGVSSWEPRTIVKSFDLTGDTLVDRSVLDLGGYVTAVQATPQALLVARDNGDNAEDRSLVSIIDISSIEGTMVEGEEVTVAGYVQNKFNMDLYNGVLRVVSTEVGGSTNMVETFDASSFAELVPIDQETFGDGMQLFATIFLGNKAFFATYLRTDPFHAFEITDEGDATEISEYVISGWNDYFRPVFDETRLLGIGVNDESGSQTMAVSLYDITDLSNPEPFIARAEVEAESNWSEASYDDRAFSIIENAVEVTAPDGTPETGLVLLPFSGWNSDDRTYESSVQIYTFSANTLTRRGVMEHGTQVRRSFQAGDELTANLSEAELTLYDTSTPDSPVEYGRLELVPAYAELHFVGDYAVRLKDRTSLYGWWGSLTERPGAVLEVIPASGNLDAAESLASVEVPGGSSIVRNGNHLFAISGRYNDILRIETTIVPVDLTDPTNPVVHPAFVTNDIPGSSGSGFWDCYGCGWFSYYDSPSAMVTDSALVFVRSESRSEVFGVVEECEVYSIEGPGCNSRGTCQWLEGNQHCQTPRGGTETCDEGDFRECTLNDRTADITCVPVQPEPDQLGRVCSISEDVRTWQTYSFIPIDTRDISALRSGRVTTLAEDTNGVSVLTANGDIQVTWNRPVTRDGDAREWRQYFMQTVDMSDPMNPILAEPVNIPGELVSMNDDIIYTRDLVLGERFVEATIARLQLRDGLAYLQSWLQFEDQIVEAVALEGAGNLLVSHSDIWDPSSSTDWWNQPRSLTILDADTLVETGNTAMDARSRFAQAVDGRALFAVPGGMMVMNVEDPSSPFAQAWFPTPGWWSNATVRGDRFIFAAGPVGITEANLNEFNLLPPM